MPWRYGRSHAAAPARQVPGLATNPRKAGHDQRPARCDGGCASGASRSTFGRDRTRWLTARSNAQQHRDRKDRGEALEERSGSNGRAPGRALGNRRSGAHTVARLDQIESRLDQETVEPADLYDACCLCETRHINRESDDLSLETNRIDVFNDHRTQHPRVFSATAKRTVHLNHTTKSRFYLRLLSI